MMRLLFTFLFILIFPCWLLPQINPYGIPFITNYTPQEYGASEQNWAISQDFRGLLYIGNDEQGVMEYDGVRWRKISIGNNSAVRSLVVGNNGSIYYGGVGEIGLLNPNEYGQMQSKDINNLIDSSHQKFADVWKAYSINDRVFYCTTSKIFEYNNKLVTITILPKNSFFSFLVNDKLLTGSFVDGLNIKKDTIFEVIKNGQFFSNKGIYTIDLIKDSSLLVGTYPDGLYKYSFNGNIDNCYKTKNSNTFLKENQLYCSQPIDNKSIAFGTLSQGLLVMDLDGEIKEMINKTNGLQDETVINIFLNAKNSTEVLWAALNSGVAKIEINNPFRKFDYSNGLQGSICDILNFNNKIFVATSLGVFYMSYDDKNQSVFRQIDGIEDLVWSFALDKNNNSLLAGSMTGLYSIDENLKVSYIDNQIRSKKEPSLKNYITKLSSSDATNKSILVGKINAFFTIKHNKSNWQRDASFSKIVDEIVSICQPKEGSIWLGTNYNGVINIKFSDNDTIYKYYNKESGLPSLNDIFIQKINGRLLFGTEKGLYHFNDALNLFEPDSIFGKEFCNGSFGVFRFNQSHDGYYWFSLFNERRKWVERGHFDSTGIYVRDSLPFKRLPNEQFDAIYHDSEGFTWLGSSSGLYSFNPNVKVDYYKPYHTLVRKVTTVNDSVLFWGTNYTANNTGNPTVTLKQPTEHFPVLDYTYNDLTFEYAAPYFIEEKKTEYSYLLDGYKDTWSKWTTEPKAVFTNLREGKYNYMVKAKNIYGIESTIATYQFSILPPWYRTGWAYIIYILLGVFLMVVVVKLYTRKLRLEKIQLEEIVQQRTAEIRCQKEDIERKSEILKVQKEEIEVQAIHLGRANKILHEQKEEIFKQKEEITSSIKYAKRIQRAIVPSEEEAQRLLKDYFLLWRPRDIVSGDFWWMGEKDNLVVVAAADCTGHGVPGAFMSMLGVSFLNEIVNQQDNTQSHEILNKLRTKVKSTLGQTGKDGEAKDGMDIALMVIDFDKKILQYSGAYNPMYLCRNNELIEFKADKNPIGIYIKEKESFTQNIVELQKGDTLYIFSDGYVDQFGGENQMKYMSKRFKEFLLTIQAEPMEKQKELLNASIDEWRGKIEQIDDIIVLGVRII